MVKGVNKTIIEINDTGNEVFEKVVLYVRPQCAALNKRELRREAEVILKDYSFEDYDLEYSDAKPVNKKFLFLLFGFMLAVAVTALLFIVF